MTLRVALACSLLIASACGATLAQTPAGQPEAKPNQKEQPLRLNTELLQVRAVVTDRAGRAITDLKKEDFELLENDRPQPISFFSVDQIGDAELAPPAAARAEAAKPPRLGNPVLPSRPPSRTIVLFADTLHLSKADLSAVKATLKKFVDQQMTADDLVALITSTGQLGPLEQFTRDKQLLRFAIDRLALWNESSRKSLLNAYIGAKVLNGDPEAIGLAFAILQGEESSHVPWAEVLGAAKDIVNIEAARQKATLKTLSAVAGQMAELPGQRLIFLLSEGFSTLDAGGSFESQTLDAAISSAVRSGVTVYALDAGGLKPEFFQGDASLPRDVPVHLARYSTLAAQSRRDPQVALQDLARGTGGEAFLNTNDLSGKLQKALDDNRFFYTLAFYPPGNKPGAGFNRIGVRVVNHPDYVVRTQRGYMPLEGREAAARTPRQKMLQALESPLPLTGLGVTAQADFLEWEADDAQASLQVFIDGRDLSYTEQNQRRGMSLELAGVVFDLAGKAVDSFSEKIEASLMPERVRQAEQNGYRYTRRLRLKPGQYQARVAVRESATGHVGTATAWIDVPDLRKRGLSLSSIALSERPAAKAKAAATGGRNDLFAPKVARGLRTFRRDDFLVYYLMIYGAAADRPAASGLTMQVEMVQGERAIYKSEWQPVSSRVVISNKKGVGVSGQMTLQVGPGIYELRVSVNSPATGQTAQQSILFAVEPGASQAAP